MVGQGIDALCSWMLAVERGMKMILSFECRTRARRSHCDLSARILSLVHTGRSSTVIGTRCNILATSWDLCQAGGSEEEQDTAQSHHGGGLPIWISFKQL